MADAAPNTVAVNEDGIPIQQGPSAIADELGINTPKIVPTTDPSAFPHFAEDAGNYIVKGPDKMKAIANARDQPTGPPAPAINVPAPANAAAPVAALPSSQQAQPVIASFQQPGVQDLGDGTALVPRRDGSSVRIALSAIESPGLREQILGGMPYGDDNDMFRRLQQGNRQDFLDSKKAATDAADAQIHANNEVARVAQQKADDEFKVRSDYEQKANFLETDGALRQQKYQQVMDDKNSQLQSLLAQQKAMTFDPDRYVKSQTGTQRLLTALSVALGAMGQAFSHGGSNVGLDMLNQHIEHDIMAQKEAYNRGLQNIDVATNAYARAREAKMDDAQATQAARLVQHDHLLNAINVVAAKNGGPGVEANRQLLNAKVGESKAKTMSDLQGIYHTHALQIANMEQQQRHFNYNARLAQARMVLSASQNGKPALSIPGFEGTAATPDEHKEAIKVAANERQLLPRLDKLIGYRTREGNEFIDQSDKAMARSTASQLKVMFKDKFGLGVMSESDSKLLDSIISDPTSVAWTPAVVATLKQLRDQVVEDTTNTMDTYGLRRAKAPSPYIDKQPIAGGRL